MKVRVKSGFLKDWRSYVPGDVVDFDDVYAAQLVEQGIAEAWEPETACVQHANALTATADARGAGRKRQKR